MMDKEQIVMACSASGLMAAARWYLAAKDGRPFRPFFFVADLFISMGMGYFAFLCASELGYTPGICAMASGLAGAIGSRSVDIIQFWVKVKIHMEDVNDCKRNQKQ